MSAGDSFTGGVRAIRNSSILIATQCASILIRLCYLYILVRYLSPSNYGALTYGMYWYLVVLPFTYLGAEVVLAREIGRDRSKAPALLGATLWLRCLACIVATLASVMIALAIEGDPYIRSVIMILSLSIIGRSLWMWCAAVFTAFEEVRPILWLEVVFRVLEIAVLIILLEKAAPGLRTIAAIHSGFWLAQGIVVVWLVLRRWPISRRWSYREWIEVIREGLPGAAFAIATALFFQLPVVLFRQVQGTGDSLGYFALAFQIVTVLAGIPVLIANASLPVLSRSAIRKDGKDRAMALFLIIAIIVGGSLLLAGAYFAIVPVVRMIFGDRYEQAAIMLQIGLWLLIPATLAMLLQNVLFSNAVRSLAWLAPLIGVAVMVLLFSGLTRAHGFVGALSSVAIGLMIWVLLSGLATIRSGFFKVRTDSAAPLVS